jgi:hypothetical protein
MGIDARVEREDGQAKAELVDPYGLTARLLASLPEAESLCLRFVDPYGDTTFNQLQLPIVITELAQAIDIVSDPEVKAHGHALLELAREASNNAHTYLKLYGD